MICDQRAAAQSNPHLFWAYVGTTSQEGISLFKLDTNTGSFTAEGIAAPANAPGFLAIAPNQKYLYAGVLRAAPATREAAIEAFAIDGKTGKLTALNEQPSGGDEATFVTVDPFGKNVLVAHYNAATVSVLPIGPDGRLSPASITLKQTGSSIDPARQTHAYAHSINADPAGKFAIACDLGADKLFVYKLDADKGVLAPNDPPSVSVPPGSGPRHLTFHPNGKWVYVVTEMGSTVIGYNYDAATGTLHQMDQARILPDDFKYQTTSAEVQIDPTGKFLYTSTRIALNLLTVFTIDQSTGKLARVAYQDTMGRIPRHFRIDPTGKFLLVANQQSDNVILFSINPRDGRLTMSGPPMDVPAPICVKFVAVEGQ